MAYEIECKYKIMDSILFKNKLEEYKINLSNFIIQNDNIYMRNGKNFSDLYKGEPILRIRQDHNGLCTTAKKYVKGTQIRKEIECRIFEKEKFEEYLEMLGFHKIVTVNKHRAQGIYHSINITYDIVDDLGEFAEIEIIDEIDDELLLKKKLSDIDNFAIKLGLNTNNKIDLPYDEMIYRKGQAK